MTISYSIRGTPLTRLSEAKREFLGLTGDRIFQVGIEFMSFMNQRPNGEDETYVLRESLQGQFAQHLAKKGWKWAYDIPVLLSGASWSRKV
jgi:hypothetical protein